MSGPTTRLTAAIAIALLASILCSDSVISMAKAQCEGDIPTLISECAKYVRKQGPKKRPSAACCGAVKTANLPCLCKYVTEEIEQIISVDKAVYVAKSCGVVLMA